jgi:hypothetical protein
MTRTTRQGPVSVGSCTRVTREPWRTGNAVVGSAYAIRLMRRRSARSVGCAGSPGRARRHGNRRRSRGARPIHGAIPARWPSRRPRSFIADWLRDEDYFGTEASAEWFGDLADFVAALPLDAHRIRAVARFTQPLLDDDEGRIEAALYPNGSAVAYVERTAWGGDLGAYLDGFVEALGRDFAAWKELVRDVGAAARWPAAGLKTAPPAKLLKGGR